MNCTEGRRYYSNIFTFVFLVNAGIASAQQKGNLHGEVTDGVVGAALPGVTLELKGEGTSRFQVTNDGGYYRFLELNPGRYILKAELEGFVVLEQRTVDIRGGHDTILDMSLALDETAIVGCQLFPVEGPTFSQATTTVSQIELEKIPTARDPWAVLNQAPGVLTDRVNVGGSESGQQAHFNTSGMGADENNFVLDGVAVTDMVAAGSSLTYYDFDQFSEIQITTGGADVTTATAGVTVNLVTKRGSNTPRGSGRYFLAQADDVFGLGLEQAETGSEDELPLRQSTLPSNRIEEWVDFGFEAGGAVVRDRLWGWGSYSRSDIEGPADGALPGETLLENTALKLNGQPAATNAAVVSWNRGDRRRSGLGAGPFRAPETTLDESSPMELWKLEDTYVFSANFYLTGFYSYVDGGIGREARGGRDVEAFVTDDLVRRGSYFSGTSNRDSTTYQLDGSYFLNTGSVGHELRFGGQYREFAWNSDFSWPGGRNVFNTSGVLWGFPAGDQDVFVISRRGVPATDVEYTSLWLQDTVTGGRWTLNAGLRYDQQEGENPPVTMPANPALPEYFPARHFAGTTGGFSWQTISPRLSFTHTLGKERETLLRATYGRFAGQLKTPDISRLKPVGFSYTSHPILFTDSNGDNIWQENEDYVPFIIDFPLDNSNPNRNDPNLDPEITDALQVGLEHMLLPELVVGANVTYRLTSDILEEQRFVTDHSGPTTTTRVVNRDDFVLDHFETGTLPNGRAYSVPVYGLRDGVHYNGGRLLTNGDREIVYRGASLTLAKRLANRWMARGFINYGEAEWDVPSSFFDHRDPTNLVGNVLFAGGDADGELFAEQSTGSGNKGDVFLQSGWSVNLTGLYQVVPDRAWGFNVAANLTAREGFPLPYVVASNGGDGLNKNVQVVDDFDEIRTDDVVTLDLRLEKDFRLADNLSATFSLDAFNIFNENTVLQRERNLAGSGADFLDETLSPRIYRFGFRVNWR